MSTSSGGRNLARQAIGRYGEGVAVAHLEAAGLRVIARNWRCREGEIDIVAEDGDVLVMCEVKTRTTVGFGTPIEAVTPSKAARLRRLAARWLAEQRDSVRVRTRDSGGAPVAGRGSAQLAACGGAQLAACGGYAEVRFDVVAVLRPLTGPAQVEHVRGAF